MVRFAQVLALVAFLVIMTPAAGAGRSERIAGVPDTGAGRVRIAIVDSGADTTHPLLESRIVEAVDCNGSGGDPARCTPGGTDDTGHGTHVAGIVASVAPDADLLVVRSLHEQCEPECQAIGRVEDVVAGIKWATLAEADVVNLSIDAGVKLDWRDGAIASAIRDAWAGGTIVVASTGNRGKALDDGALADVPALFVGALDAEGKPADYQNAPGPAQWALLAPGGTAGVDCGAGAIESTYPRALDADGTGCLAGTSMAAAHATGAVAVLVSHGLDNGTAVAALLSSAADLGAPGKDGATGAGALDLDAATSAPPVDAAPSVSRLSVPDSGTLSLETGLLRVAPAVVAAGGLLVGLRALAGAARRARPTVAH